MNRFFSKAGDFLETRVQITQLSESREHLSVGFCSFEACAVVTHLVSPRLIAVPPSPEASSGHSVVHARAPRRASGRRRRALGLPPGAGARGAARAAHPPPARVPVRRRGKRGRDVVGGAAVEAVRPHKQDHLPWRGGEAHVQRARCVTGPARDAQPPIAARLPSPLPVRDDRFNKHTQEVCKKQQKKSNTPTETTHGTKECVWRACPQRQWVPNDASVFFFESVKCPRGVA